MSVPWSRAARRKLRPMRPNPLMPTRTVIAVVPQFSSYEIRASTSRRKTVEAGCQNYRKQQDKYSSDQTGEGGRQFDGVVGPSVGPGQRRFDRPAGGPAEG